MCNALNCTSMQIVRRNGHWEWDAFFNGARVCYGYLPHTGQRPRVASMVRAIPRKIKLLYGEHWDMPAEAQNHKAWFKLRGQDVYCWEAK